MTIVERQTEREGELMLTVGISIRQWNSVSSKLLECPELVDTVKDGIGPVDQAATHLLQMPQNGDVTVRLHPWSRNTHHSHLWV